MQVDANEVINKLLSQIAQHSKSIAILEAQVDFLTQENSKLREEIEDSKVSE